MGRIASWGYVAATLVACGALVACAVESGTGAEKQTDPSDPGALDRPQEPSEENGAAPTGGSRGGTSGGGTSGTSGTTGSTGTPEKDAGTTSGSSGTSGTSGTPADAGTPDSSSGGTSGSSGTPSAFDAFQQKNLVLINQYRATKNLAPLVLDAKISTFALAGSKMLAQDHQAHHHFVNASNDGSLWTSGFQGGAAENQGDPNGWYKMSNDPVTNEMMQIASIQKAMFDEGPGTGTAHGHYMNMMNPKFHRVGVGLFMVGTSLYLTNDFSN